MKKDENAGLGVIMLIVAVLCFTWLKEDSFSLMGMVTVKCKTLGWVLLVVGLVNVLGGLDSLGDILILPFLPVLWAIEYWYVTLALVAAFFLFRDQLDFLPKADDSSKEMSVTASETLPLPTWEMPQQPETVPQEPVWATEPIVPYVVETTPAVTQEYPGDHRNVGVCKNLTRNAELLLIYVNDSGSSWTQDEIGSFNGNMIHPGMEYMMYHAGQYGYGITIDDCLYTREDGTVNVVEYTGTVISWDPDRLQDDLVTHAAQWYGFATPEDMIKNVQDYAYTEQVAIVFLLDKPGRSYAQWNTKENGFVEYAVIFSSMDGNRSQPDLVAHEVMHLFGADDLYAEGEERANRASLVKQWYPRELFYQGQWNLYDNVISPYTAYTVGWLNTLPPECDRWEWWE